MAEIDKSLSCLEKKNKKQKHPGYFAQKKEEECS